MLKRDDKASTSSTDEQLDDGLESESEPEPEDDVKFWKDGFKNRYYQVKFGVDESDVEFRHNVAAAYVEGLCWVLNYYYQGCSSWKWFFPYNYSPFASDFINIEALDIKWNKGTPFKPLDQLVAVLPAASKQNVPDPWGDLMSDPESPIIDFYPTDFKVELNGKKYTGQGFAVLPFIEEDRLLKALETVYPTLTAEEMKRNNHGKDRLYLRKGHKAYKFLTALYENGSDLKSDIDMDAKLFSGISGVVSLCEDVVSYKATVISPIQSMPDLPLNVVVCVNFMNPKYEDGFIFPADRLTSAVDPPSVLREEQMPAQYYSNVYRSMDNFKRPTSLDDDTANPGFT